MKKLLLFIFLIPFVCHAQFSKGEKFIGGSINASLSGTTFNPAPTTNTSNYFYVAPSVGYFTDEKTAWGLALTYNNSYQKSQSGTSGSYNSSSGYTWGLNPFIKRYWSLSNSIYFALKGQVGFTRGNSKNVSFNAFTSITSTSETPMYQLDAFVSPSFIFFPTPQWGIETGLSSVGYTYTRNLPNVSSSGTFGLNAGSISLGLAYYFGKK
ncbi:MAG: hypothetical protein JST43_05885 [Bacteroidetes bacterium]|nr:hypothetical protein [Bacteroidota bacterium]MBS1539323.1 hypothetical protein [Bacteroidota bacterium]